MAVTDKPELRSGRYPLVTFRIRRSFPRPAPELVARFEQFFVPDISDLVGRMYTMDGTIRPMYQPAPRVLGSALTVKCPPGDNMGVKQALRYCEPGDVLVVDAMGFTEWCLGGFNLLQRSIRERGLRGAVVNGAYRDASEARAAGFPIYVRAIAPWSGPKRGPCEINVPVCCGSVIVHPGDLVVGDEDGLVVVPRDYIERVAARLEAKGDELHPRDRTIEDLAAVEAVSDSYFQEMFVEKAGIYLDIQSDI